LTAQFPVKFFFFRGGETLGVLADLVGEKVVEHAIVDQKGQLAAHRLIAHTVLLLTERALDLYALNLRGCLLLLLLRWCWCRLHCFLFLSRLRLLLTSSVAGGLLLLLFLVLST